MRTSALKIVTGLLFSVWLISDVHAGPPLTGAGKSAGQSTWSKLNPTQWNWPSLPWSEEPPRIQKKTPSMMSSMNKTAKTGWEKTKRTLNPTRFFNSDSQTKSKPQSSRSHSESSQGGFFSGIFKSDEPKQIKTVNDFLSQPHPR